MPFGLPAATLNATTSGVLPCAIPAATFSATIELTPVALSVAAICASVSPAAFKLAASDAKNTASSRPFWFTVEMSPDAMAEFTMFTAFDARLVR